MPDDSKSNELFISVHVPKVSRTFALAMQFLPDNLRQSVNTAYLLCRVIDTVEDSTQITPGDKSGWLLRLKKMLLEGGPRRKIDLTSMGDINIAVDSSLDPDHQLLSESGRLFEVMDTLPGSHKEIIYRWAAEMAGGMAEYASLVPGSPDSPISLENCRDWDRYCYYVAGTVGRMLTELFIEELPFSKENEKSLMLLCDSFGLGLQKVNTIKDAPIDRQRGIMFLPGDLLSKNELTPQSSGEKSNSERITMFITEVSRLALRHLDDARDYVQLISEDRKGIRMFLIVPIFLALETLNMIFQNPVQTLTGPPVKISRLDVTRLTALAAVCSTSNRQFKAHYQQLLQIK